MNNEMIESDSERVPYPGVRKIVEKTLPRFAVEQEIVEGAMSDDFPDRGVYQERDVYPDMLEPMRGPLTPIQYFPAPGASIEEEMTPEAISRDENVTISLFSEAGYLIERTQREEGILTQRERWTYTTANHIERKVTEDIVNENIELEERTYDDDGRLKRKVVTYADHSQIITDHLWRNQGQEQEEITRSDDGIEAHYIRKYNAVGNVVEESEINPETGEKLTEYSEYDANDHVVEIGHILEGERVPLMQYTYDDSGHEIECIHYAESGQVISTTTSNYDGDDCIEERIVSQEGEAVHTITRDDQHRIIHSLTESPDHESEVVIEYDDNGRRVMEASRRIYGMNSTRYTPDIRSSTTWYEYSTEVA